MERVLRGFQCQSCQQFFTASELAKHENDKERVCPKDGGKVVPAIFCEKYGYQCPSCKLTDRKPANCKKCGKPLQKVTDRAKVVYRCTKCKTNVDEMPANGLCASCGKALKMWCSKSGTFPHGTDPTNNAGACNK